MLSKKDFAGGLLGAIAQSRSRNPLSWIRLFQILNPQFFCGDFFDSIGQIVLQKVTAHTL